MVCHDYLFKCCLWVFFIAFDTKSTLPDPWPCNVGTIAYLFRSACTSNRLALFVSWPAYILFDLEENSLFQTSQTITPTCTESFVLLATFLSNGSYDVTSVCNAHASILKTSPVDFQQLSFFLRGCVFSMFRLPHVYCLFGNAC